jgi:hypothetical protein
MSVRIERGQTEAALLRQGTMEEQPNEKDLVSRLLLDRQCRATHLLGV